jgi:hypothetical protein
LSEISLAEILVYSRAIGMTLSGPGKGFESVGRAWEDKFTGVP